MLTTYSSGKLRVSFKKSCLGANKSIFGWMRPFGLTWTLEMFPNNSLTCIHLYFWYLVGILSKHRHGIGWYWSCLWITFVAYNSILLVSICVFLWNVFELEALYCTFHVKQGQPPIDCVVRDGEVCGQSHVVPDLSPGVCLTTLSTVYRNNYLRRFCTSVCWAVWPSNIVVVNHCQIDKTQDTFLLCKRLCFNPNRSPDAAMELVWKVIKGKWIWRRYIFGKFNAGCEGVGTPITTTRFGFQVSIILLYSCQK